MGEQRSEGEQSGGCRGGDRLLVTHKSSLGSIRSENNKNEQRPRSRNQRAHQ